MKTLPKAVLGGGAFVAGTALLLNHEAGAEAAKNRSIEVQAILDSQVRPTTYLISAGTHLRSIPSMTNPEASDSDTIKKTIKDGQKIAFINPLDYTDAHGDEWLGAKTPGAKPTDINSLANDTVWVNLTQLDGQHKVQMLNPAAAPEAIKVESDGSIAQTDGTAIEHGAASVEFNAQDLSNLVQAGLVELASN